MRTRYPLPLLALVLVLFASCEDGSAGCACTPPPPAPQGLADCAKYLLGNFYADDATFTAGVQGCVNWVIENEALAIDDEDRLLDCSDEVGIQECARSLNRSDDGEPIPGEELFDEDLAGLDLVALDPPRDPSAASGVVTLMTIDCTWPDVEAELSRPDQAAIFDTWESYVRTYLPDEAAHADFSAASADADRADFPSAFLETVNEADAVSNALFDLDPYDLFLDFRHGVWPVSWEDDPDTTDLVEGAADPTFAFAVISYGQGLVLDEEEGEGFRQQYSVELNIERSDDRTTRIFATWAEPRVDGVDPDDDIVFGLAGRESRASMLVIAEQCQSR